MQTTPPTSRWLLEGAVIVFSILLAFAIDAAWDSRSERQREAQILQALAADFEAVRELLPAHVEGHRRTAESIQRIVEAVESVEPGTWVEVPRVAILQGFRNASFDAPGGAVDALISSGDLRLISDLELRSMLAAWPSRLQDAIEDDRMLREFWGPEFRRVLIKDINLLEVIGDLYTLPLEEREKLLVSIPVSNELRGILPNVLGSSRLADEAESQLLELVDAILEKIRQ